MFNLTVNYLQTFSSYSVGEDGTIDRLKGFVYIINNTGQVSDLIKELSFTPRPPQFQLLLHLCSQLYITANGGIKTGENWE